MIKIHHNPAPKVKRRKNIQQGFYVKGKFHPIRASYDYDESRVGKPSVKKKKNPAFSDNTEVDKKANSIFNRLAKKGFNRNEAYQLTEVIRNGFNFKDAKNLYRAFSKDNSDNANFAEWVQDKERNKEINRILKPRAAENEGAMVQINQAAEDVAEKIQEGKPVQSLNISEMAILRKAFNLKGKTKEDLRAQIAKKLNVFERDGLDYYTKPVRTTKPAKKEVSVTKKVIKMKKVKSRKAKRTAAPSLKLAERREVYKRTNPAKKAKRSLKRRRNPESIGSQVTSVAKDVMYAAGGFLATEIGVNMLMKYIPENIKQMAMLDNQYVKGAVKAAVGFGVGMAAEATGVVGKREANLISVGGVTAGAVDVLKSALGTVGLAGLADEDLSEYFASQMSSLANSPLRSISNSPASLNGVELVTNANQALYKQILSKQNAG